ncbi:hypothetical protein AZSP09_36180 (plasmid) [Azospira sp. I09]|nr:hypothetical protein AZSP09_36180 [Azospira sp. I09]
MGFLLLARDHAVLFQVAGGLVAFSAWAAHSQFRAALSCATFVGVGLTLGLLPTVGAVV